MLDTFESISPTAIMTSYPRIFADIPYEKEVKDDLKSLKMLNIEDNKFDDLLELSLFILNNF